MFFSHNQLPLYLLTMSLGEKTYFIRLLMVNNDCLVIDACKLITTVLSLGAVTTFSFLEVAEFLINTQASN